MDVVTSQAGCAEVLQRSLSNCRPPATRSSQITMQSRFWFAWVCNYAGRTIFGNLQWRKKWCHADPFLSHVAGCRTPCLGNLL
jgi:hypothetical protein